MFRKVVLLCGLIFASIVPVAQAPAQAHVQPAAETRHFNVTTKDIDATLENSWFGTYVNGKKVGNFHIAFEKVSENDQIYYRTSHQSEMKIQSLGTKGKIKLRETLLYAAHPPFALLSGEYASDDGKSQKRISLTAKGVGCFEVTTVVGKETRKSTRNDLNLTLSDSVSAAIWLKKGPARGETISVASLNFEELCTIKTSMRMVGTKEITHNGAKLSVSELEKIENRGGGGDKTVIYCDRNGFVVSSFIGGFLELRKESESEARKTEFPEDLIFTTMAKLDRPIGDLAKVKGMTLKGKGKINALLPPTALQMVTQEKDDVYVVKIGKHHGAKVKATTEEIKAGLEENETYPINDEKVLQLARKVVGDAKTAQEKVNRLCKFVHETIKYEIVYLPKVHDILERKVGDCKSYALLFTCLARAVGLPTHEATGYFYMGDELKGFGGHAWNEVLIDGHWTPVDATLGHTDILPFYICVGRGSEGRDNIGQTMGKLSFELVDVELGR